MKPAASRAYSRCVQVTDCARRDEDPSQSRTIAGRTRHIRPSPGARGTSARETINFALDAKRAEAETPHWHDVRPCGPRADAPQNADAIDSRTAAALSLSL